MILVVRFLERRGGKKKKQLQIFQVAAKCLHANNKFCLHPSVTPCPAGAHRGFCSLLEQSKEMPASNFGILQREKALRNTSFHMYTQKERFFKKISFCLERLWWLLKGHLGGKGPSSPRHNQHPQLRNIFKQRCC